jgi:membrane associated rhomboid family serine protease
MTLALPRPGRALWAIMLLMAVLGISTAFLIGNSVPGGAALFASLVCRPERAFIEPWRLVTSGLLTDPREWTNLLFSLGGLYFLGAPLERRWGSWRFARFLALGVLFGNLAAIGMGALVPPEATRFRPEIMFGPWAAITAIAIAWSREFADSTVSMFFVLPVRGKTFFWITLGLCVLDLIYPSGITEGVIAPFGGMVAGLLFGGSPSLVRTGWLRLRLAFLRRGAGDLRVKDVLSPSRPERRQRSGGPPLRVVPGGGGLDEVLKKRQPPKDKRYLN